MSEAKQSSDPSTFLQDCLVAFAYFVAHKCGNVLYLRGFIKQLFFVLIDPSHEISGIQLSNPAHSSSIFLLLILLEVPQVVVIAHVNAGV